MAARRRIEAAKLQCSYSFKRGKAEPAPTSGTLLANVQRIEKHLNISPETPLTEALQMANQMVWGAPQKGPLLNQVAALNQAIGL